MHREHIEANRLIDCAEAGDRKRYAQLLLDIHKRYDVATADNIAALARRQIKMRDWAHWFSWRVEWVNKGRRI